MKQFTVVLLTVPLVVALVGGLVWLALARNETPVPVEVPVETCWQGEAAVYIPELGGMAVIGETELCGVSLRLATTYGPSVQTHVESLKAQLAEALDERDRWKDCAQIGPAYCPKED